MAVIYFLISGLLFAITFLHIFLYEAFIDHSRYALFVFLWIVIVFSAEKHLPIFRSLVLSFSWLSSTVVLLLSLIYLRHWCTIVYCMGATLNFTAMLVNQNKMPVMGPYAESAFNTAFRHKLTDSGVKFLFICDWIVIPDFCIASIGDVLVYSSGFISLVHIFIRYSTSP